MLAVLELVLVVVYDNGVEMLEYLMVHHQTTLEQSFLRLDKVRDVELVQRLDLKRLILVYDCLGLRVIAPRVRDVVIWRLG